MDQGPIALVSCRFCAAQMPDYAAFCPGCGRAMKGQLVNPRVGQHDDPQDSHESSTVAENVAGALAYFTFVAAIILLAVEPYRRSRFVRFHAIQCLFYSAAAAVIFVVLRLLGAVLFVIPTLGPMLVTIVDVVVGLAVVLTWLVLVVKAFQGERFGLPLLGAFGRELCGIEWRCPAEILIAHADVFW